jgi:hypothetical protein
VAAVRATRSPLPDDLRSSRGGRRRPGRVPLSLGSDPRRRLVFRSDASARWLPRFGRLERTKFSYLTGVGRTV